MKKFAHVLTSVLLSIGIATSLILTFGWEWYQIILFSLGGIFTGLLYYSPRGFLDAFRAAAGKSQAIKTWLTNRPVFNTIAPWKRKDMNERLKFYAHLYFYIIPFLLAFMLIGWQLLSLFGGGKLASLLDCDFTTILGTSAVILILDVFCITFITAIFLSFDGDIPGHPSHFEIWSKKMSPRRQVKVWGRELKEDDKVENFDKNWKRIKIAAFRTVIGLQFSELLRNTRGVIAVAAVIIVFLFALVVQTLSLILVLIAMIFMTRDKYWRLIIISSIVGILINVWQHSFIWGFAGGTLMTIIGFITNWINKAIVEIRPVNVFKSGPYVSVYQYLKRNILNRNQPPVEEKRAIYLGG